MAKKSKEIWKTYKNVFDDFTLRTVFKLMSQQVIDGLESPIEIGKEANIFTAITPDKKKVIVKIYRLEGCNFNKMYDYIKQDARYTNLKKQRREIIFSWVQREYRNLMKAREAGVSVPTPMVYRNNVLVMEYIGDEIIAQQLKNSIPKNIEGFLKKLVTELKKLYNGAGLVHADLSEFNILNYKETPVLIDFSQSTMKKSNNSDELLKRDIKNIIRFFKKIGLKTDKKDILNRITL